MKIENIIRRVLREQEEENLSELPPIDDFFDSNWNLVLNFMNRYPNKKFYYHGDLNLRGSDIKSLGNLVRVEGNLDLYGNESFQSLGNLEYVGSYLNLRYTKIETLGNLVRVEGDLDLMSCKNLVSLGNLEYVGDGLDLFDCKNLKSLGNLEYVGGRLDLWRTDIKTLGNLKYVGGYLDLRNTPSSKKYTKEEIRKMVEVVGVIDM